MSERMSAYIQIGGRIRRSRAKQLITKITASSVSLDWGDALYEPKSVEDLPANLKDDRIWLCDDQASWGEFPELEHACRQLGLSYTRCCDGGSAYDAEREEWRPGMRKPLVQTCSNVNSENILVSQESLQKALDLLDLGRHQEARRILRRLCPRVPPLPVFEIV